MDRGAIMTSRCDCCDLELAFCGKDAETRARAEARQLRAARLAQPGWIPAQYRGSCADCCEWFEAGTPIRHVSFGWIAECCAGDLA